MAASDINKKQEDTQSKAVISGRWSGEQTGQSIFLHFFYGTHDDLIAVKTFDFAETSGLKSHLSEWTINISAGQLKFSGVLDKKQSHGKFSFLPDKDFFNRILLMGGTTEIDSLGEFGVALSQMPLQYITEIRHTGIQNVGIEDLIGMFLLKIKPSYIKSLSDFGYSHLSANELFAAKALNLDEAFLNEKGNLYHQIPNPSFPMVLAKKAEWIGNGHKDDFDIIGTIDLEKLIRSESSPLALRNLILVNVSTAFLNGLKSQSIDQMPITEFWALQYSSVNAKYLLMLKNLGYNNISSYSLAALSASDVNENYINFLKAFGYDQLNIMELVFFKVRGIDRPFLTSIDQTKVGFIPKDYLLTFKALGIDKYYIDSLENFKFKNIDVGYIVMLKSQNISPEHISKLRDQGFISDDVNYYIKLNLKSKNK
ncbi:MAG: hypothetical protein M3O71_07260 [Bacteroidota bacterium]|nr:hypothetical protein [Bacteroidota bacterium]